MLAVIFVGVSTTRKRKQKRGRLYRRTSAQTLVFPADEDSREYVSGNEKKEEDVVQSLVSEGIENGQQDKTDCTDNGEEDGQAGKNLLS